VLENAEVAKNPSQLDFLGIEEMYAKIETIDVDSYIVPWINSQEILLSKLQLNIFKLYNSKSFQLRQLIVLLEVSYFF
jgi:hypothetical protein